MGRRLRCGSRGARRLGGSSSGGLRFDGGVLGGFLDAITFLPELGRTKSHAKSCNRSIPRFTFTADERGNHFAWGSRQDDRTALVYKRAIVCT